MKEKRGTKEQAQRRRNTKGNEVTNKWKQQIKNMFTDYLQNHTAVHPSPTRSTVFLQCSHREATWVVDLDAAHVHLVKNEPERPLPSSSHATTLQQYCGLPAYRLPAAWNSYLIWMNFNHTIQTDLKLSALMLRNHEVQGSNLSPETDYSDSGLSRFSSVPPGKYWDSTINMPRALQHISKFIIRLSSSNSTNFKLKRATI